MEETRTTIKVTKTARELLRVLARITGEMHYEILERLLIEDGKRALRLRITKHTPLHDAISECEKEISSRGKKQ